MSLQLEMISMVIILFSLSHLCSHADLYAEDCNLLTPVLTAAVHEKTEAFCFLMKYVDMNNPKQNPIFKAIETECIQEMDFNVSFGFVLKFMS